MSSLQEIGDDLDRAISHAVATGHYKNLSKEIKGIAGRAVSDAGQGIKDAFKRDDSADYEGYGSTVSTMKDVRGRNYKPEDINENEDWQETKTARYIKKINEEHEEDEKKKTALRLREDAGLYDRTTMKKVGAIAEMAAGYSLGLISGAVIGTAAIISNWMLLLMVFPAAFIGLGVFGTVNLMKYTRFDRYLEVLSGRTYAGIKEISDKVGSSQKKIVKDLKKMINEGLFRQGHIDEKETTLITSDKTYDQYLITEKNAKEREEQEERERLKRERESAQWTEEQKELFKTAEDYLAQIHRCNDEIPGEVISEKISRMEHSVSLILDEAKKKPRLIEDMRRLLNYYLPTTIKLLNAYADLDRQGKSSENIEKSKKEIEDTIDTLNDAFDKLFDEMFEDTSLDISTDVEVMKTLLEQEGLTGKKFSSNNVM